MGNTRASTKTPVKKGGRGVRSGNGGRFGDDGRTLLQRLGSGVWGLAIVLLGILLLFSLVSFRSDDVSAGAEAVNVIGPVGAWVSYIVFYLCGFSAYLVAAGAIYLGALLIAQRVITFSARQIVGFAVVLAPAMVLLHLGFPDRSLYPRGGGGLAGYLVATALQALLHTTGTVILAVGGILGGISLMFRVPVSRFFSMPFKGLVAAARGLFARSLAQRQVAGAELLGPEADGVHPERMRRAQDGGSLTGAADGAKVGGAGLGDDDETVPSRRPVQGALPVVTRPEESLGDRGDAEKQGSTKAERGQGGVKGGASGEDGQSQGGEGAEAAAEGGPGQGNQRSLPPGSAGDAGREGECAGSVGMTLPSNSADGAEHGRPIIVTDLKKGEGAEQATPDTADKPGVVPLAPGAREQRKVEEFHLPEASLLEFVPPVRRTVDDSAYQELARLLGEKLADFKVDGDVESIHPGPVITLFEFKPGRGIKVAQVANLSKDLAMALAAEQVRVIAPIPGRDVVGIEIPNKVREMVYLRELIGHAGFRESKNRIPLALGKDIAGNPVFADLTKMPHLLVAGTTGSGKSVLLHAFIMSMVYRMEPSKLRFILVDTKMLELTAYAEIPHLLLPVVTEAKEATAALRWAVGEMERRNRLMSQAGVPNIAEYNEWVKNRRETPHMKAQILKAVNTPEGRKVEPVQDTAPGPEPLPYIVVVIDELADLMMVAGKQVETSIVRLAQMARAAGIHMVIATQNPTIKVVTGIIKANMPSRVACKVRSMQDSRVILDQNGADDLLGWGDMLFLPPGSSKLQRIHGAFVSTEERMRVVEHLRTQGAPEYNFDIMASAADVEEEQEEEPGTDDIYRRAKHYAIEQGKVSTSALQRELGIGYNKAALIMTRMEKEGLVGPQEAAGKPRVVLA